MIEEKNKKLIEDSKENIEDVEQKLEKEKNEIKTVKKETVDQILNSLNGVALKFGDCVFKINYLHLGKNRFSAECINTIKQV